MQELNGPGVSEGRVRQQHLLREQRSRPGTGHLNTVTSSATHVCEPGSKRSRPGTGRLKAVCVPERNGQDPGLRTCRAGKLWPAQDISEPLQVYLTKCIYQLVLESQHPHKIVNLLFTITNSNIKLTVLWGS